MICAAAWRRSPRASKWRRAIVEGVELGCVSRPDARCRPGRFARSGWRAGLWRHAVGCRGFSGDRRPEETRPGRNALSAADEPTFRRATRCSIRRAASPCSRPFPGAAASPARRRAGRRRDARPKCRRRRRKVAAFLGSATARSRVHRLRREPSTIAAPPIGATGAWSCVTPSWPRWRAASTRLSSPRSFVA